MAFATTERKTNPVNKFLDYKGSTKKHGFVYWDKEEKVNKDYNLGKFVIVDLGYTIKGYNNETEKGIYSNEIKSFADKFRVMSDGKTLIEGNYKEIKDSVKAKGGNLYLGVTAMNLENGELIEFFLKGQAFYDFTSMIKGIKPEQVIEYEGDKLIEGKAFDYYTPKFKIVENEFIDGSLKEKQLEYGKAVDEYYASLKSEFEFDTVTDDDNIIDDEVDFDYKAPEKQDENLPF